VKLLTAVVKPFRVDDVVRALRAAGGTGATVTDVKGMGRQGGHTETYRGSEYRIDLVPKVRVEVLVSDEQTDAVLGAIADAARTGRIGDGKVWIREVDEVIRTRTGEAGAEAV
jgi:nitrogen regulatory protein P-II 1